ncbi:MAG: glycosyltransferase family 2 protein [bacterium]
MTPARPPASHVTLVVPARNEEAAILDTLRSLPLATLRAMGFSCDVVVLDGHSHDRTAAIAAAWGATVVPDRERGKGAALRQARGQLQGDLIVMLDADGTYAADAVPRIVARLAWGSADVVMGRRVPQPGSMSATHRAGNRLLSLAATVLYGRRVHDVCTGLWGLRAPVLRQLPLRSTGFGLEAELFGLCVRTGCTIAEVRVDYLPRRGVAKLTLGRDGMRIARRLVRTRLARLPRPDAAAPQAALDAARPAIRVGQEGP